MIAEKRQAKISPSIKMVFNSNDATDLAPGFWWIAYRVVRWGVGEANAGADVVTFHQCISCAVALVRPVGSPRRAVCRIISAVTFDYVVYN